MARGFVLQADPRNTEYRTFVIASQAYTIGDLVDVSRTAADVVPSTSSSVTYGVRGVAMETKLSTDTTLLVALANADQRWTADTTNAANTAHNGQRMVLTDQRTVNNTGTDSTTVNGVFEQLGTVAQTNANRIVGRILATVNITA